MLETSVKDAFRATLARFHAALKDHDHPKLAELHSPVFTGTPEGPDVDNSTDQQLVNVKSLEQLIPKPNGDKRNTVRYGGHDDKGNPTYLSFDNSIAIDTDNPGSAPAETFIHLLHLNALYGSTGWSTDAGNANGGNTQWYPTNVVGDIESVAGGIASSNRLHYKNSNAGIATPAGLAANYPGNSKCWSESFLWEPNGYRSRRRNIFRVGQYGKTSDPQDCAVFMSAIGTDNVPNTWDNFIVYLRTIVSSFVWVPPSSGDVGHLELTTDVVNSKLVVDKTNIPGARFIDGTKYFIELVFNSYPSEGISSAGKGYYSVWINGVKMPIYTTAPATTLWNATGPHQHEAYLARPVGAAVGSPFDESRTVRMLGGQSGGSAGGYIEEYAFKEIEESYDPAANYAAVITANAEQVQVGIPAEYIGTSNDVFILSNGDTDPLYTSASNKLDEYTKNLLADVAITDLSVNNKCFIYLENDIATVNPAVALLPKFTVQTPQFGFKFDNNGINGLQSYWDADANNIKLVDVYGSVWNWDDADTIQLYSTDFTGCGTLNDTIPDPLLVNPVTDWALFFKNITTSAELISNIFSLKDRWTVRIGVRRTTSNFGVIYQTLDRTTRTAKKGIKLEYTVTDGGTLRVSISHTGSTWDVVSISDASIRSLMNTTTAMTIIEVFYTGNKYGIRVGGRTASGATPTWVYDEELVTTENTPTVFESNAAIALGGVGVAIPNIVHAGFQVLPYVYKDHVNGAELPTVDTLLNVDPEITYFDKSAMETLGCVGNALTMGTKPTFESIAPRVYIGEVILDKGGVRSGNAYAINARYESEWMLVDTNTVVKVLQHYIGCTDLSVEVFFNTEPTNVGMWKDTGLVYASAGHLHGVGIRNITTTELTLKIGNDSVTNLGSAPTPGTPVTEAYMKVVATRNW